MEPQHEDRRLTTILAADVVGYSRLMASDESGTLAQLKAHRRELIEPKTVEHHGRIVKLMGDGTLMEFTSVVDAVNFAVDVQRVMAERNAGVPDERQITYRIGINIGDIIVEDDDIYGDGVNIASRLEGLAEAGGICISGAVFDQVHNKLDFAFSDMGEQMVKNIANPIRVFKVETGSRKPTATMPPSPHPSAKRKTAIATSIAVVIAAIVGLFIWQPWVTKVEPASIAKMTLPLPEKPSIAVLSFNNLSDDKDQEFFADGITEDIITDLSKVSGLFVVARNSTFAYKGKAVKIRQIAEELGVRYVLEGSVRKSGGKVRITAQLIDAIKGSHTWAERYDRKLEDTFAVGDDVVKNVVAELAVALKAKDHERLYRRHAKSLEAYQTFLQAKHTRGFDGKSSARREELYRRVTELDPEFAGGFAGLSLTYREIATHTVGPARKANIDRALAFAERAMKIDETFVWSYLALGGAYYAKREFNKAVITMRKAVELQPSDADAWTFLGFYSHWAGYGAEAVAALNTAERLNPNALGTRHVTFLTMANFTAESYQDAIKSALPHYAYFARRGRPALAYLAAAYAATEQDDKATATMKVYLDKNPKYTIANFPFLRNYKRIEDRDRLAKWLRKAGMPKG